MQYEWALVRYASNNETGKKAVELANAGVGYHIINKERGKTEDVILAFKFPLVKALPSHLEFASKDQAKKLDDWQSKRNNTPNSENRNKKYTKPTPFKVPADIFVK